MTRKVIIRGHVFDYAEKAPFVVSGQSVLGATEYDESADKLKCHECGQWQSGLANHVFNRHHLRLREYRLLHGLNLNTCLNSKSVRASRSVAAKRHWDVNPITAMHTAESRSANAKLSSKHRHRKVEKSNEIGRCMAQSIFRLQVLAAEKGHTPTSHEINASGIDCGNLICHFGSISAAQQMAGLMPNSNRSGPGRKSPLPPNFPSKEDLWKARMPWPKEYFDAGLIALERKQA